jgi:hypothetical protein
LTTLSPSHNPASTLLHDARGALHHHLGTALHVPWVVLVIVLVVVAWRRLPAPYGAFATAVVLVALSGTNLDSFERYAFSAFPLLIAAALIVRNRRVETLVFTVMGAAMCLYGVVAALGVYVP